MRIAIIHDDLTQRGGAERVVEAMHSIWPDAPIYTSVYDSENTFTSFSKCKIHTSFMQKIPFASNVKYSKLFLPLYPIAFETFDLRGYDIVISHGTRFSHGVVTSADTCHIHYCHTPARFAWRYHEYVEEGNFGGFVKILLPPIIHKLRQWDMLAALRVDTFFANSHNIAKRVMKFYGRESEILYPPIETGRFYIAENPTADYFLVVSRLLPYKRIDLAIEACNALQLPLKVIGTGPDFNHLKSIAGPTVEILGRVPDGEVEKLFANCRAFIFPGEEDFGIAPLEAMASGRPVIAFRAGGAIETVIDGETGVFFNEPKVESLMESIRNFESITFNAVNIRAHAEKFSVDVFKKRFLFLVEHHYSDYKRKYNDISSMD